MMVYEGHFYLECGDVVAFDSISIPKAVVEGDVSFGVLRRVVVSQDVNSTSVETPYPDAGGDRHKYLVTHHRKCVSQSEEFVTLCEHISQSFLLCRVFASFTNVIMLPLEWRNDSVYCFANFVESCLYTETSLRISYHFSCLLVDFDNVEGILTKPSTSH